MATATEIWEGRGGTGSFPNKRTYTRVFEVTTDTATTDGPNAAARVPGIHMGDPHPEDAGAVVVDIDPQQDSALPTLWRVTFKYDSHPDIPQLQQPGTEDGGPPPEPPTPQQAAEQAENPLNRPPVWKFTFQQSQVPARVDRLLNPIRNSAGMPFDPPVMVDESYPLVSVSVNRAVWLLTDAAYLQDAVNSDTWFGMEPRTLRCVGIEAESATENGVNFWKVVYNLAIKWDRWDFKPLDCGFHERIAPRTVDGVLLPAQYVLICDEYGGYPSTPSLLDGNGRKLAVGEPEVYLPFRVYREIKFRENLI